MRTPLIAGNWKMHHRSAEATEFAEVVSAASLPVDCDIAIFPPYTSLHVLQTAFSDSVIQYGAQNMHWEASGAFTGELSVSMLHDMGCTYVLIGHSERRQYFAETDETVNKKLHAALDNDLTPVVCVGENLETRKSGNYLEFVSHQVKAALSGVETGRDPSPYADIVIAYEPIWAIGTGETATPEQAQEVHATIREIVGEETRILYGGSVKPANCAELMAQPDIDGALVGGASLQAESFLQIVNYDV